MPMDRFKLMGCAGLEQNPPPDLEQVACVPQATDVDYY